MSTTSGSIALAVQLKESLAASSARLFGYDVPIQPSNTYTITDGSTAGTVTITTNAGAITVKANKIYQASGTASATPTDIDLTTTTNVDGTTGFSYVRLLLIFNDAATDGYTLTYGGGTNPFKPTLSGTNPVIAIDPGGFLPIIRALGTNGHSVTNSSNDIVRLDPGSNNVPYRIVVAGS